MDINTLRGLSTLFMLVAFLGLVFWAYSSKRKKEFDEAAQLPFADEPDLDSAGQSTRHDEGKQS